MFAADCAQVRSVDDKISFDGALVAYMGCKKLSQLEIKKLQGNDNPLIRSFFANYYYSGNSQPADINENKLAKLVSEGLINRNLASFFFVNLWADSDLTTTTYSLDYFQFTDNEVRTIFEIFLAADSVFFYDQNLPFALPEIDSVEILMASRSIPLAADYLSYAYLHGVGVRTNIEKSFEYSEQAAEMLAEAVRYKGVLLLEAGASFDEVLNNFRSAANMHYIPGIMDLAENLHDQSVSLPEYEDEYREILVTIENLGFSGVARAQRLLAVSYESGIGVAENPAVAREWYEKASKNGNDEAAARMMSYLAQEGDYDQYVIQALRRASTNGYVETDGYLQAVLGIHASDKPEKSKIKLIQFVLHHCRNNPWVSEDDQKICENYPIPAVEFEPGQDLFAALSNPQDLRIKDELKLPTGNYYALVIGNQKYDHWPSLKTPLNDINSVSSALSNEYSFDVKKITDASRGEILSEIYNLGAKAEFNDHVLLYYAGHGVVDEETDEGYWIPSSADQNFRPDWVSNSDIKTALKSIKARHLLVMADSCYSGTLVRAGSRVQSEISNPVIKRLFSKKARVAITSGGNEPVVDSVSGSKNSVFASAFLDALRGNNKNFLPASMIFSSIRDKVTKEANQTPVYANIRELDDDGGEFVFQKTQ